MVRRECKIGGEPIAAFRDCTFEEAAFKAVEIYCSWKGMQVIVDRSLEKWCVTVKVEDPDSAVIRDIKVEIGLQFKWVNPRQGVDY